jgi:putative ABC transport system permease protein
MLADVAQDIRYSLRSLAASPAFTVVAVIALALGIGANTAVFSVFRGVLLNPLPYPQANRLVWLWPANARTGESFPGAISPPDFLDFRKQSTAFENLAAFLRLDLTLNGAQAERLAASGVSAGFFETFGVHPALGRSFLPEDEDVNWPQVAILSDGLWRRHFGADPSVIGRKISLDGKNLTVAGVMPPDFNFPQNVQLWQPLPLRYEEMAVRRFHFLRVVGRLKPGVTLERADKQMKSIASGLARAYPDSNANYSSKVVSLLEQTVGNVRPTLTLLLGAVAFVLLIACANVAHLQLARAAARRKEIAIRSSLGAGAGRILRQLLTESLLLGLLGGALGSLLAVAGLKALVALHPANLPRLDELRPDAWIFGFTAAVSLLTGLVFGLLPALRASRPDLVEALKDAARGSSGRGHHLLHNFLVTAEVAFAVVLLAGAGLMIRSFQRLKNVNPGFDPNGVLTMRVTLPMKPGQADHSDADFYRVLLPRIEALPGVKSAALVSELPLGGSGNDTRFTIDGRPASKPSERPDADDRTITSGYFTAMRIPLLKGRYFLAADRDSAPNVAIVSRSFAEKYFPGQDAVGQHLAIDHGFAFHCEIVGVVGDVLHRWLAGKPYPTMYTPNAQGYMRGGSLVIRGRTDLAAVRREVQSLNADVPVFGVQRMTDLVADSVGQPRFRTLLLGLFAAVALLLAAAGIYGVMSYSVTLRTHEIGIRLALGAGRREVMRHVVGRGMGWAVAGVAAGLAAAFGLTRLVASMLYEIRPNDPVSFTIVPVVLLAVAFLACYVPARRAARLDAISAMRQE